MATTIFEYLVIKNASDAEIIAAGQNGWELFLFKGADAWFKRQVLLP